METLLVHKDALTILMPRLIETLGNNCELRCDPMVRAALPVSIEGIVIKDAVESDWSLEFLDNILAIKAVSSCKEAIAHINRYGTKHSEAILTNDLNSAQKFRKEVDAACVYVNASTRFTDGGEFGFGAELGISTQKFHARGPMGLETLTAIKYLVSGCGQIRN